MLLQEAAQSVWPQHFPGTNTEMAADAIAYYLRR